MCRSSIRICREMEMYYAGFPLKMSRSRQGWGNTGAYGKGVLHYALTGATDIAGKGIVRLRPGLTGIFFMI